MQEGNYIKVKGTYYEMGYQQGEKFQFSIKTSFNKLINSEVIKILKPKLLPRKIFSYLLKKEVLKKWQKPIEVLLPEYSQRIKGLSDGAKTKLQELYVMQALEVMAIDTRYFMKNTGLSLGQLSLGCSSLCVLPKSKKTSYTILAKNFDYLSEFTTDHLIRQSEPVNGYKSIEITYKQISGAHDGMNEKGLVVLYNYGITIEKTETRIPITILVQQILERCSNIDEAIMFIKTFRYPNGAILTLADDTSRAVCVELTPEHISFRSPEDGVLLATNFYLTETARKYDIPHNAYFDNKKLPQEIRNKRIHESNEQRYYRMRDLVLKYNHITEQEIQQLLKDHNNKIDGDDNTICRHSSLLSTQVGMIFIPKNRTVKITLGNPCKNVFVEYQLN